MHISSCLPLPSQFQSAVCWFHALLWDAFPGCAVGMPKAAQGAAGFGVNCPCPHPPEGILSCEESYSLWNALIKQESLEEVKWWRSSADNLAAP